MKRRMIACFLLAAWLLGIRTAPAEGGRRLTLMIYMCGSNLESGYGSASADLQEMLSSGFDPGEVTVLVMAGGSSRWSLPFDPGEAAIQELGPRGMRTVWRDEARDMGESDTLSRLLTFGQERYPADDYALILWDHGGGPLEGVCWDELFSMDRLSLSELTDALDAAAFPKKLRFIGFDACLMSTAEVAYALSPYAEYMIASQETEPAKGWNYAFLAGLGGDRSGADTGRRVVDAYFDALEGSGDKLTMACTDLSRMDEVVSAMNDFFDPLGSALDADTFASLSNLRLASSGFGEAVRGIGAEGYDLVDLADLVEHYPQKGEALRQALTDAVVYSRASEQGAGGLSVYHPCVNKDRYLEAWRANYRTLRFSDGYRRYLERYGALLTDSAMADWSGLSLTASGADADGRFQFDLQLTPEQRENLAEAELMILVSSNDVFASDTLSLAPVSVERVHEDADGRLSAEYGGRALYVVDDDGAPLRGPISFLMSDDGSYYSVLVYYDDYSGSRSMKPSAAVLYHCAPSGDGNDLTILRRYVWDPVTETYTNRIDFDEAGYTQAAFNFFLHTLPEGSDPLPAFMDWPAYQGYLHRVLDLPQSWHLRFFDESLSRETRYALFQLTDIQQNTWCTPPVRLERLHRTAASVLPERIEFEGGAVSLSAVVVESALDPCLEVTLTAENPGDTAMTFSIDKLVLNGARTTRQYAYLSNVAPGGSETRSLTLLSGELAGLSEITSVDFSMSLRPADDYSADPVSVPVRFDLVGADVSAIASDVPEALSRAEADGVSWSLTALSQQSDGTLAGTIFIDNATDAPYEHNLTLLVDGLRLGGYSFPVIVVPHTSASFDFELEDASKFSAWTLALSQARRLYLTGVDGLLSQSGIEAVHALDIYEDADDYTIGAPLAEPIRLTLDAPIALEASTPGEASVPAPLLTGEIAVSAESAFLADNGLALALWLENDTDDARLLRFADPTMEGQEDVQFDGVGKTQRLLPHSRRLVFLEVPLPQADPGQPLGEVSFEVQVDNWFFGPVSVRLPEWAGLGAPEGTLIDGGALTVVPAAFSEKPLAVSETVVLPEAASPLHAVAPLPPEAVARVAEAWASLVQVEALDEPTGGERLASRYVVTTAAGLDGDGRLSADFCGLALLAGGEVLPVQEAREGQEVLIAAYSGLYLFRDADRYRPDADGLYADRGFDFEPMIDLRVSTGPDGVRLTGQEMRLYAINYEDMDSSRNNVMLDEIALAAVERRVYHGVGPSASAAALDRFECSTLPLDDSIALSLEPVEALPGRLGIYFAIQWEDGTRGDLLMDAFTGEVLAQLPVPAVEPPNEALPHLVAPAQ